MPHVVIEGDFDLLRIHRDLEPFEERWGDARLKVRESFLARSGRLLLLEAVAVESQTRRFLIEVDGHETTLTVRLNRLTDPEKTEGVKRLVGLAAARIARLLPRARVARANVPLPAGEGT